VSLVRKRPQHQFAFNVSATTGSWDNQRVELDLTGPLAQDGTLRGRAAAVYAHEGYFYDIEAHERRKIFGALEYDLSESGTVTAGVSYQRDKGAGIFHGLPFYADGRDSRFPRETALDFDWTRYRSELGGAYVQYRQRLAPGWAVKLNASAWRTEAEFAYGEFDALIDPLTDEVDEPGAAFSNTPNVHTQRTADLTLTGTLDWFGLREEVAIGGDFTRVKVRSDNFVYFYAGPPARDLRAFDPSLYPDPRLSAPYDAKLAASSTLEQYGMFASMRIYFSDAASVVGGARLSNDSRDTRLNVVTGPFDQTLTAAMSSDDILTPYAGVMYEIDPHYSLYASYAEIYLARTNGPQRSPGRLLDPAEGVNVEVGIKGEWRNGALNGTLALYHIEQNYDVRRVSSPPDAPACCYRGVNSNSRGIDTEISGELLPGWTIGAGYAYNQNRAPNGDQLSLLTPKHLLKAWTHRRLPAPLDRWQLGGGLHAQSETTSRQNYCDRVDCAMAVAVQPAYAVVDLRVGFDIDSQWRVALSLNNALDKVYYESIDVPSLYAWYGEPRNWVLRFDGRF
jgi:outer-membrane receptor for ferric coprogen and ferric-rhodotorulic acid